VDAQFIEFLGNPDLVLDGEGNIFRLRTITQGGIVKLNRLFAQKNILAMQKSLQN
jgi:hypothetical protein